MSIFNHPINLDNIYHGKLTELEREIIQYKDSDCITYRMYSDVNGVIRNYVGLTKDNLLIRLSSGNISHFQCAINPKFNSYYYPVYKAMRELGFDKFWIEILCSHDYETEYGIKYNALVDDGGYCLVCGSKYSKQVLEKKSINAKKRCRESMGDAAYNLMIKRMSLARTPEVMGVKAYDEMRKKISKSTTGRVYFHAVNNSNMETVVQGKDKDKILEKIYHLNKFGYAFFARKWNDAMYAWEEGAKERFSNFGLNLDYDKLKGEYNSHWNNK